MAKRAADLLVNHLHTLARPSRSESRSDGELLACWNRTRDGDAFGAIVDRHGGMVWRAVSSVFHKTQDADDVFQATFLLLLRKASALQRRQSIAGWLYQTAYRLALKARTASARRFRRESQANGKLPADPLEEMSVREAQSILIQELQSLPTVCREPILLCFYESLTQDEAARRIGCSLSTFKRRLNRGRVLLSQRLTKRGMTLTGIFAVTFISHRSVPAELLQRTVSMAGHFATGHAVTATAAALADAMERTVVLKNAFMAVAALSSLGGLSIAVGWALQPGSERKTAHTAPVSYVTTALGASPTPHVDRNGDPLPEGAVARIGSIRFRHGGGVTGVAYAPDGESVFSVCSDGFARRWEAATGKLIWRSEVDKENHENAIRLSRDGKNFAVLTNYEYTVLESATGRLLSRRSLKKESDDDWARCVAIAPDMATFARGCFDGKVHLYDAATGAKKLEIEAGDKQRIPLCMKYLADGKGIAVGVNHMQGILLYDIVTGRLIRTLKTEHEAWRLILSKDQRLIAALCTRGDPGQVSIWDLETGTRRHLIKHAFRDRRCGAFSPDNALLAIGSVLFDTNTGAEVLRFGRYSTTLAVTFSPDGKMVATADIGGCVALWEVATGKLLPSSPTPRSCVDNLRFVAGGKQLIAFSDALYWWDVKSGEAVRCLRTEPSWYWGKSVSAEGKMLATPLEKGDIVLIDTLSGGQLRTLSGHTDMVQTTAFSPDGTRLFSIGGFDPRIIVWDVATGKALQRLPSHAIFADRLTVSPDGRWLASGAGEAVVRGDYDIRIWNAATGRLVRKLHPQRGAAFMMTFSADSSKLLSVGGEPGRVNDRGEVQLWNVATGKEIHSFQGHKERVVCGAISPDGRMLATGSIDHTLRLWDVATGAERKRIVGHEGYVHCVAFSPNGNLLAASSNDAPIFIWHVYDPTGRAFAAKKLSAGDQAKLWQQLADVDAATGFRAACDLIAQSDETISFLRESWERTRRPTRDQVHEWIKDLDNKEFRVRQRASSELETHSTGYEDLMRQASDQTQSIEARRRLDQLLGRLGPERLRRTRLVEALERIGTTRARQFLQTLAADKDDALLSGDARTSLKRLESTQSAPD